MFNPNGYFFPGYGMFPRGYMTPGLGVGASRGLDSSLGTGLGAGASRGLGLFRNLGRGAGLFRSINWGNLFNNTSRALGVVNQAIPIFKQAGPMFGNMRSMLKVASAFKDVTDGDNKKNISKNTNNFRNSYNYNKKNNERKRYENSNYQKTKSYIEPDNSNLDNNYNNMVDNNPNFFI